VTSTTPGDFDLAAFPELRGLIEESLAGDIAIVRREVTVMRGSEHVHLGITVSPLTGDNGPNGAVCLFSDLTTVVALEEQLRLKEALARLGELTAGLAHEFRNGLATVHGYARLLDPEMLPRPQRNYVEGIRDETHELNEVVTNFLRFAKPDPITFAPQDVRALLLRAAEDAPSAIISVAGEFATISGDDVLLRQAFSNLFRNSVEACGRVQREPQIIVDGRIDVRAGRLQVIVRDNGPGIPEDAIAKVFQPFFTRRPGGTGLGLAIAQKVVVSHNGRISAGNDENGGAVFTLSFPLTAADVERKL
jgi:signal transduction histidine kinase